MRFELLNSLKLFVAALAATMLLSSTSNCRSRGLFAGISLAGASLRPDDDANEEVYGREIDAELLLTGTDMGIPSDPAGFLSTLRRLAGQ